eukprot:gene14675-10492_t
MDDRTPLPWRGNVRVRAAVAIGVTFALLQHVVLGEDLLPECPQWAATVVPMSITALVDSFPASYLELGSLGTWASSCEAWAAPGRCDDPAALTLMHTLCPS